MSRQKRRHSRKAQKANCVGRPQRQFWVPKSFIIIIVLAAAMAAALTAMGTPVATAVQLVAAVLATVEVVRRLTTTPVPWTVTPFVRR
ncbi:hypothetical protein [Streptomyces rubrogriseus]|uniref:hypothetical protein n=1 Tax=Streptomyces rubrogriseus TaxID=194673 RepID=UPI0037F84F76